MTAMMLSCVQPLVVGCVDVVAFCCSWQTVILSCYATLHFVALPILLLILSSLWRILCQLVAEEEEEGELLCYRR